MQQEQAAKPVSHHYAKMYRTQKE